LLPPAVRALDRLRAIFTIQNKITPGFIISLREAMGLTQERFGRKLGVTKMTISRWECGTMRPSRSMVAAIRNLQARLRNKGVKIDGEIFSHARHTG
jgi:transcriptional regulator with XRE-family HTH domain